MTKNIYSQGVKYEVLPDHKRITDVRCDVSAGK